MSNENKLNISDCWSILAVLGLSRAMDHPCRGTYCRLFELPDTRLDVGMCREMTKGRVEGKKKADLFVW